MIDLGVDKARQSWEAVEQIPYGRHVMETREELLEVIEKPLRPAIGAFFERNIETIVSSCNYRDYAQGRAYIAVCYSSLSEGNRAIADSHSPHELIEMPGGHIMAGLFFPIAERETPEVIGQRALVLAENFSVQNTPWSNGWSLSEARQLLGGHGGRIPSHDELDDEGLIQLIGTRGNYYDPTTGLVYLNELHYKRATQPI